jgi:hypothetical protein
MLAMPLYLNLHVEKPKIILFLILLIQINIKESPPLLFKTNERGKTFSGCHLDEECSEMVDGHASAKH